jgi:hypothetical protein
MERGSCFEKAWEEKEGDKNQESKIENDAHAWGEKTEFPKGWRVLVFAPTFGFGLGVCNYFWRWRWRWR